VSAVHAVTFPHHVEVEPGQGGFISVAITNTADVIDAYSVQVFGLDPTWVEVSPERVSLFPGDTANIDVRVHLPLDYPASQRTITINVVSDDDPTAFNLSNVQLVVAPSAETSIALDPTMVTGSRVATFGIVITNTGNAVASARPFAIDPEDLAEFTFDPPTVIVPPGRDQVVRVTAKGGRAWFGQIRARTFTFGVESDTAGSAAGLTESVTVETIGTFLQRPRIGRWLISLLGLLTAAVVFAAVLSRTFDRVVEQASVTDELIDAALESGEAGGAVVPSNPATVTGTLTSATSTQGLAGMQAELFVSDDTTTPVASAVTDDAGSFSLSSLGEGRYKLKLSGAGLAALWYPAAPTPDDAQEIEVALGQELTLDPVAVGGLPVEVTGKIDADNPLDLAGVTITLVAAGETDPEADALVATVDVAPDGSFTLPDIPSPGSYQLLVEKPGFATERRDVTLGPGQSLDDLELALRPGNGIISGSISESNGSALGGVAISATDGTTTVETVSLTDGAEGTFRVRDLPTPGQYTVTISKPGYLTETRSVALTEGQEIGNLTARLVPATGSISGRSTVSGVPEQGLTVTLTGADLVRRTAVVSQGLAAGSYGFVGLPAPGTYTLTFTGPDVIPQVRVVDLDPFRGTTDIGGIDVSLSPESTTVQGIVNAVGGGPATQATVTLSDGATTRTFLTADDPAGRFQFSNVKPGAYTLTASQIGTDPVVVLVNVTATSATPNLNLQLGAQASLSGRVDGFDPAAQSVTLRLFDPAQFPNGVAVATVETDAGGNYTFTSLEAQKVFVVAVYASATAADPLDSVSIETEPSIDKPVPPFTVTLP
jgi:hypothetical protein